MNRRPVSDSQPHGSEGPLNLNEDSGARFEQGQLRHLFIFT